MIKRHHAAERRAEVLAAATRHGVTVEQLPSGAWRLRGPSVYITVEDLALITIDDLKPKRV